MDPILQAYTGLTVENKGEDGIPHRAPIIAIDMSTALYAYSAVSTALYARRDQPRGRHIEASLLQAAAGLQVVRLMQSYLEGGAIRPPGAPSGVYQVADGWITVTVVRLHEWLGFCRAVGLPDFAADERFATTQGRCDHSDDINAVLRPLLASQPFAHWSQRLAAERIMHEQLNSYTGFLEQPQVEACGAIAWLHHPHVPTRLPMPQVIGAPPLVDGSRLATAPGLGEHTETILHEHGYSAPDIADLIGRGVVAVAK
jgi:crotonobetainyl-CoA:carnitine CoA-transferase CaiB-like acyl-CoA transferase